MSDVTFSLKRIDAGFQLVRGIDGDETVADFLGDPQDADHVSDWLTEYFLIQAEEISDRLTSDLGDWGEG